MASVGRHWVIFRADINNDAAATNSKSEDRKTDSRTKKPAFKALTRQPKARLPVSLSSYDPIKPDSLPARKTSPDSHSIRSTTAAQAG